MNISKITYVLFLLLMASAAAFAQEEGDEVDDIMKEITAMNTPVKSLDFNLSGSVDMYYRSNTEAPATSFGNLPGFALGMANLIASYEGEKVGFVADLVIGPRGEDAVFASPFLRPLGSSNIVNQLYVYLNLSDKVKVTFGNFNTFLGYEVISPTGNFNYSTSYMFSYGPFSHTGLKLDFDLGNGFSLMTGVFNPTDATEYNPTDTYFGGAQLGYSFDGGSAYLNTLFDDEYFQIDLTAGVDLTDALYLGVNATSASDNFWGAAGYLQLKTSDDLKLGARVEYFSDKGIGVIALDESVVNFTLSANYEVGNLTIIPELRLDAASIDVFDGGTSGSLSSFTLAAVYGF